MALNSWFDHYFFSRTIFSYNFEFLYSLKIVHKTICVHNCLIMSTWNRKHQTCIYTYRLWELVSCLLIKNTNPKSIHAFLHVSANIKKCPQEICNMQVNKSHIDVQEHPELLLLCCNVSKQNIYACLSVCLWPQVSTSFSIHNMSTQDVLVLKSNINDVSKIVKMCWKVC